MRDHAQQMKCARIFRIGIADKSTKPLGFIETTGAMLRHRGGERLFGTAPGIHGDIFDLRGLTSVA
jgi:hypothetical protein